MSIAKPLKFSLFQLLILLILTALQLVRPVMAESAQNAASLLMEMAAAADVIQFPEQHRSLPPELKSDSLAAQFQDRFASPPETSDHQNPRVRSVINAFRAYWTTVLLDKPRKEEAEQDLTRALSEQLDPASATADLARLLTRTQAQLEREGFHALLSPPAPLADLLIWSRERRETFKVALPTADREVEVVFVDDMVSAGWLDYASLGLSASSGWTDGTVLYTPTWAYDTKSEAFHVSYLVHEAQHLQDLESFPALSSDELEYRAKLAELATSHKTTRLLLERFSKSTHTIARSPHERANKRVIEDMRKAVCAARYCNNDNSWFQASHYTINRAANRLLLNLQAPRKESRLSP